jgi:HlyD family secretion protein
MQVQAGIDEADVGQVKIGQTATFSVDAFPDRKFNGTVAQIRLQPTTMQNVVSYTVMIDVQNTDLALLPGMTANLTLTVQSATDVLKVPMAALKFAPPRTDNAGKKGAWAGRGATDSSKGAQGADAGTTKRGGGSRGRSDSTGVKRDWGGRGGDHVFLLAQGKLKRVAVKKGLANAGFAAVEGDIKEGDSVVVGTITQTKATAAPANSPLGGMPRRF